MVEEIYLAIKKKLDKQIGWVSFSWPNGNWKRKWLKVVILGVAAFSC